MALKGNWIDKINGVDVNSAEDINQVAHAVIEVENSVNKIPAVDDTLRLAGAAADAKAVGDRLAALKNEIPEIPVRSVNGKTGAVQLAAADVGADAAGTADSRVGEHNVSDNAHNDIRLLIDALTTTVSGKEASGTAARLINRSTAVNAADTNYTTLMARGSSLNSAETTPAVNGAIAWTYE